MHYPLLDVFLTMLFFFVWLLWIFLVIRIAIHIFKSHDLSGLAKAAWLIFVILVPFIGVIVYVIARGRELTEEPAVNSAALQEEKFDTVERYMGRR